METSRLDGQMAHNQNIKCGLKGSRKVKPMVGYHKWENLFRAINQSSLLEYLQLDTQNE